MVATATIVGGTGGTDVPPVAASPSSPAGVAVMSALANIQSVVGTYTTVVNSPGANTGTLPPSPPNVFTLNQFTPTGPGVVYDMPGTEGSLVATGDLATTLVGVSDTSNTGGGGPGTNDGLELIYGNGGDDTIDAAGGHGTVITGAGYNLVELNATITQDANFNDVITGQSGGAIDLVSTGTDTVQAYGGSVTIDSASSPLAPVEVDAITGSNTISGNALVVVSPGATAAVSGNDTIYVGPINDTLDYGSSTDTVQVVGMATAASSGLNQISVTVGAGASVTAGSANATLIGGSGSESLTGGTGTTDFVAGSGPETLTAGSGPNTYDFAAENTSGNTITIENYSQSDIINLNGYTTDYTQTTAPGGGTELDLSDGTKIILDHYTGTIGAINTH